MDCLDGCSVGSHADDFGYILIELVATDDWIDSVARLAWFGMLVVS